MRSFIVIMFVMLVCVNNGQTQVYKSILPSPEFTKSLEKVVLDFRFNFNNVRGNAIMQEGGTQSFESNIKLPGSSNCFITYYSSRIDTTASWQAVMYSGSDFNEAVTAYNNLFRMVKKSHLNWIDRSLMRFSGKLEVPKKEVAFATSILQLDLEDKRYKRFAAEIELVSNGYENFEVHLNLQNRKNDDEQF